MLFNPSDFGLVKKLLPSEKIAAGPAIRIYVFFICNIPFSRFINGKCFVGQCGRLSRLILKKAGADTVWHFLLDCRKRVYVLEMGFFVFGIIVLLF